MSKITFEEQVKYCELCATYIFANNHKISPSCNSFNVYKQNPTNEICPCSECLFKFNCKDDCLELMHYIEIIHRIND